MGTLSTSSFWASTATLVPRWFPTCARIVVVVLVVVVIVVVIVVVLVAVAVVLVAVAVVVLLLLFLISCCVDIWRRFSFAIRG